MNAEQHPIRDTIVEELRRRHMKPYKLAKKLEGVLHQSAVYRYLQTGNGHTRTAEKMLRALNLKIVPAS